VRVEVGRRRSVEGGREEEGGESRGGRQRPLTVESRKVRSGFHVKSSEKVRLPVLPTARDYSEIRDEWINLQSRGRGINERRRVERR